MSSYILYPVLELQNFIWLMLGLLFLETVLVLFFMGQKKRGIGDFKWQALFFGRSVRELLLMALGASQMCFVIAAALFPESMGTVQIAALAVLCAVRGVLGLSLQGIVSEAVYGLLMGAALMIENLLRDYMQETGVELYIGAIWVLLAVFIVQYSVYYFIRGLERMLQRHEKRQKRKIRQESV